MIIPHTERSKIQSKSVEGMKLWWPSWMEGQSPKKREMYSADPNILKTIFHQVICLHCAYVRQCFKKPSRNFGNAMVQERQIRVQGPRLSIKPLEELYPRSKGNMETDKSQLNQVNLIIIYLPARRKLNRYLEEVNIIQTFYNLSETISSNQSKIGNTRD